LEIINQIGGGVLARVVSNSRERGIKKAGKLHGKTTPKTLSKFEAFSGGFFVGICLRILTLGAQIQDTFRAPLVLAFWAMLLIGF